MPQTTSNPPGLCIGAKTIPERKQIYSCNGILDPSPGRRYKQAYPFRYRWKWRKKSKKKTPPAPPLPSYEEENWEEEIGSFETYGFAPYGPEDVDRVALQGLTLNQTPCPPHPQTATDYSPATHHQAPVKWVRHIIRSVEEQFVDAED